jgi:RHS repeat-associated protein
VVAVTDADGERVASYNYEAFGTIKDATGALDNIITYTGRWIEPETGDYFYRARYYDSGVGRFLKRDPIGFLGGDPNLYRFSYNNPTNMVDLFGESSWAFSLCMLQCMLLGVEPFNKKDRKEAMEDLTDDIYKKIKNEKPSVNRIKRKQLLRKTIKKKKSKFLKLRRLRKVLTKINKKGGEKIAKKIIKNIGKTAPFVNILFWGMDIVEGLSCYEKCCHLLNI